MPQERFLDFNIPEDLITSLKYTLAIITIVVILILLYLVYIGYKLTYKRC